MKHKIFWLVVIVAVAAGFYFYKNKPQPQTENKQTKQEQAEINNNNSELPGNTLTGTLRASNDKKRGNLMLELADSDRIIYMTSSRDFSSLYGKEVVVSIDGDLSGFKLLDIKAK